VRIRLTPSHLHLAYCMYLEQREREGMGKAPGEEESFCLKCKDGGDVLLCEFEFANGVGCMKSYHPKCCHLKKAPEGLWECPRHRCVSCGAGPSRTDAQGNLRTPDTERMHTCRTCPVTYCGRCLPRSRMPEGDEMVCDECHLLAQTDTSLLKQELRAFNPDLFHS